MNSKAEARRRAVLEALARAMEPLIAARAKERQESGRGADGSGGRGKRKNLCQKSDKGFDTKKEAAALARRNLTSAQRIEVSMKREPLIAARAKENQKAGGGSGPSGRQKSAQPSKTREEAAALAGVSHDTFHKGKVALNHGSNPTRASPGTPTLGG